MQAVAESGPASPLAGAEGTKDMRAHASQVKIVALCALLLAVFTPALAGCQRVCTAYYSPPPHAVLTVVNGVVYGVGDTRFALRARDGKVLWQNAENPYYGPHGLIAGANPSWWTRVAPIVDGQTVIETMGVALFMALRASDGKILWHSQPLTGLADSAVHGALDPSPVVADGVIYAAAGYGAIAAWDERDGRSLWVARLAPDEAPTNPTYSAYSAYSAELPLPVVAGSTVYASAGRAVFALRAADGSVRWHLPDATVGISYSVPIVAANTVYVADSFGAMFALDGAAGTIRWHAPPGSTSVFMDSVPTVVLQGQIIYAASGGVLCRR